MEKINHYLTYPQMEKLRKLSETTGLSISEIIRRALDEYLEKR